MNKKQLIIILLSLLLIIFFISGFILCSFGVFDALDWEHRYGIGFFLIITNAAPVFGAMTFLYEYYSQPPSKPTNKFTNKQINNDSKRL